MCISLVRHVRSYIHLYFARHRSTRGLHSFPTRRSSDLLAGVKMRVPDGEMPPDLFRSLDAVPVTINVKDLYEALKTRRVEDRKSTRLNSSHANISYAVFCLKKKKKRTDNIHRDPDLRPS